MEAVAGHVHLHPWHRPARICSGNAALLTSLKSVPFGLAEYVHPIHQSLDPDKEQCRMSAPVKYVYLFGSSRTDGATAMKNLLGGKGANLAEMCRLGITVPAGFTISTEACTVFTEQGKDSALALIRDEVLKGIAFVEQEMDKTFGNAADPLLLSVRSGARASMPGMMDTILNLGLNDQAVLAWRAMAGNERFAWDSYRRFVQMYGDVVMGLKPVKKEDHDPFEVLIDMVKDKRGVQLDTELDTADLKELVARFKALIRARIGRDFPTDPWEQLWGAVVAVFESWNNDRARVYRELNDIPQRWGTAVNVQAMVFGNLGNSSATGVAFTRDAGTGEDLFNGEFLVNAQGEDVVAGIRTPQQVSLVGSRRWAELAQGERRGAAHEVPVAGGADARDLPPVAARRDPAGKPLQGHAGRRVHDPGGPPVDAADA